MIPGQDLDPRNHWCHVAGCAAWGSHGIGKAWGCKKHLPAGWQSGDPTPRVAEAVPAQGALL